jgi:heme/copper-type cytochrome/quinol oxidase subunit 2
VKIIKKKKNLLLSLCLLICLLIGFVFWAGSSLAAVEMPDTELPEKTMEEVLTNAVNWLAGIVALVSVLIVVIAGVLWATAGGDEDRIKSSRKWLIGGLGGLAVALGAWAMVKVIVMQLFGP